MLPLRKHKVKLGSPPRGRGKGKDYATAETMQGITPAWAGKSWLSLDSCLLWWDHPRMGGEKLPRKFTKAANPGSPPHGRGKVNLSILEGADTGITPAWAGKSMQAALRSSSAGDHPRMGGEKPPHWWRSSITEDHPRMGGEKNFSFCISNLTRGSPPHGRGKAGKNGGCDFGDRITPAWAGKSFVLRLWCVATQDHPRMGGEKFVYKNKTADQVGSPPHGRGKAPFKRGLFHILGITPAWAGKRMIMIVAERNFRDHPRMGGEKAHQCV